MRLKKSTGEIYHQLADRVTFTRIFKRTVSIINLLKDRGLEVLYLTVLFVFSAGLINGLIEGTNPIMENYVIFPQRGVQTLSETIVYVFAMAIGSGGIYLLYMGGRQSIRRRISDFYFILGFSSVLLAITLSLYIFTIKV
ncbi:MAG: hypothetical protein V3W09_05135 [Nitrososphaerales archaeon]